VEKRVFSTGKDVVMSRLKAPKNRPLMAQLGNIIIRQRYGKAFDTLELLGHHPGYPNAYLQFSNGFALAKTQLEPSLKSLIVQLVAQHNNCAFCMDLSRRMAKDQRQNLEKLDNVLEFATDPRFSSRERAALAYALEATQNVHVQNSIFAELQQHFSEREIIEITVAAATENFYNRIAAPLEIASAGLCAL
jgi:alkylhydroperoxidase family enzyme